MKVVIDTSAFIKAIFHGDKWTREVLNLHINKKIKLAMNPECFRELFIVFGEIAEKVKPNVNDVRKAYEKLINALWNFEQIEHITFSSFCEHESDNKFVDCAIDSQADYILTYNNQHFTNCEEIIKKQYGITIKIRSPYQFIMDFKALKLKEYYDAR